jgi:hypothetical protein
MHEGQTISDNNMTWKVRNISRPNVIKVDGGGQQDYIVTLPLVLL